MIRAKLSDNVEANPIERKRIEQVMSIHSMGGFRFPKQLPKELERMGAHMFHLAREGVIERRKFFAGDLRERRQAADHLDSRPGVRAFYIEKDLRQAGLFEDRRAYNQKRMYADRRASFDEWIETARKNPKFNKLVKKYLPKKGSPLYKSHLPDEERIISAYVKGKRLSKAERQWVENNADAGFPTNEKQRELQRAHVREFLLEAQRLAVKPAI